MKIKNVIKAGLALLVISSNAFAEAKYKELTGLSNRILLSSVALSVSDFESRTGADYEKVSVYEKMYTDSSGMVNYHKGVGDIGTVKGLILIYKHQGRAYIYYNGKYAYSAELTESLENDINTQNLGTQLFAISNYQGVIIE